MNIFRLFGKPEKLQPEQVKKSSEFKLGELDVELAQNKTRGVIEIFLDNIKVSREDVEITVSEPNYGETKNKGEIPRITFDVVLEGKGKKLEITGLRLPYAETNPWTDQRILPPELTEEQKTKIIETFMEPDQGNK